MATHHLQLKANMAYAPPQHGWAQAAVQPNQTPSVTPPFIPLPATEGLLRTLGEQQLWEWQQMNMLQWQWKWVWRRPANAAYGRWQWEWVFEEESIAILKPRHKQSG